MVYFKYLLPKYIHLYFKYLAIWGIHVERSFPHQRSRCDSGNTTMRVVFIILVCALRIPTISYELYFFFHSFSSPNFNSE